MGTIARQIQGAQAPATDSCAQKTIRFMPRDKAKKAGQWAMRKYASVFKKLAE